MKDERVCEDPFGAELDVGTAYSIQSFALVDDGDAAGSKGADSTVVDRPAPRGSGQVVEVPADPGDMSLRRRSEYCLRAGPSPTVGT